MARFSLEVAARRSRQWSNHFGVRDACNARPLQRLTTTQLSGICNVMENLTDIQSRLVATLRRRAERGEPPPSYRELCAEFGWSSTGTARDHLQALARKDYVKLPGRRGGRARLRERVPSISSVPIVGRVVAGLPVVSHENVEGMLPIPAEWTRRGEFFALRVTGESMKDAGILESDYVVIRKQPNADSGDIVAATIEGETTLKRFVRQGKRTLLVPENASYEVIEVSSEYAITHGVVVGLWRDYGSARFTRPFPEGADSRYLKGGHNAHGS